MSIESLKQSLEDKFKLAEAYQKVFDSPEGEMVLRHLVKVSGMTSVGLIRDPNLLMIQQGRQNIVLHILKVLGKDKQQLIKTIESIMIES